MLKKRQLIFTLFIFNFTISYSQINNNVNDFRKALKEISQSHPKELNFKKSYLFYIQNKYDSTLIYTHKFINLNSKNRQLLDYCHFLRATCFKEKEIYSKAKNEFNLITQKFKYNHLKLLNLGIIALNLSKFEKSLTYLKKIEFLESQASKDYKPGYIYHNIGLCYLCLFNYSKAQEYLFKSLKIKELKGNTDELIKSYTDIANLYYSQYQDKLAISFFEKSYQLSKKTKNFTLKRNAAGNMAVIQENLKNYSAALKYRKEYENWVDQLNDQNKVWEIAEKEKKFSVNLKEKEIKVLEAENKIKITQRNWLIYSFSLLIIIFVIGIYFYKQKIKTNKIILSQRNKLDELNATKDQLFSIVSHDLRSSVNALKTSNTRLLENLESQNYTELDKLLQNNSSIANGAYNLLDNLLNWALLQTKQLYFQKETLHLYSIIQQIEYNYKPLILNKNIRFENLVTKDHFIIADLDSFKIILRNVLDNAIKFCKDDDLISIYTMETSDNFHQLVIEDTGIGMSQETQSKLMEESILLSKKNDDEAIGTGLGFQLCKTMIQKNGGEIRIESIENKGTKIILTIPKSGNNG